ncbi:MAG: hypothetical protein JXD23_15990 [Spirochaetales bacterium]|nr:hypothetical protein [Spirochaetales bacterium]
MGRAGVSPAWIDDTDKGRGEGAATDRDADKEEEFLRNPGMEEARKRERSRWAIGKTDRIQVNILIQCIINVTVKRNKGYYLIIYISSNLI